MNSHSQKGSRLFYPVITKEFLCLWGQGAGPKSSSDPTPSPIKHPSTNHGLVGELHLFGAIEWGCLILYAGGWD
jgi:hypothetical protein